MPVSDLSGIFEEEKVKLPEGIEILKSCMLYLEGKITEKTVFDYALGTMTEEEVKASILDQRTEAEIKGNLQAFDYIQENPPQDYAKPKHDLIDEMYRQAKFRESHYAERLQQVRKENKKIRKRIRRNRSKSTAHFDDVNTLNFRKVLNDTGFKTITDSLPIGRGSEAICDILNKRKPKINIVFDLDNTLLHAIQKRVIKAEVDVEYFEKLTSVNAIYE